jgi:hypothetical protein
MPNYRIHIATTADVKLPPPVMWSQIVEAETPEAGLKEVVDDLRSAPGPEPLSVHLADRERILTEHVPGWDDEPE